MSSTASAARIAANKANGLKSTGPRTEAGKAAVANNALKHGLRSQRNPLDLAKDTALPFKQTEFLATLTAFMAEFASQSPFETLPVERLAQIDLRLNRATRMETAQMEHHAEAVWKNIGELLPTDPRSRHNQLLMLTFDRAASTVKLIHQYESRLSRDFARTLAQRRHAQNIKRTEPPVDAAQQPDPLSTTQEMPREQSQLHAAPNQREQTQRSPVSDATVSSIPMNDAPPENSGIQTQSTSNPLNGQPN